MDEVHDEYLHVFDAMVSICVEMIGDIGLFLVFDAIDVFPQSVFDFAFGLAYILFIASCALYAVYEIRTVACDCFFGGYVSVFVTIDPDLSNKVQYLQFASLHVFSFFIIGGYVSVFVTIDPDLSNKVQYLQFASLHVFSFSAHFPCPCVGTLLEYPISFYYLGINWYPSRYVVVRKSPSLSSFSLGFCGCNSSVVALVLTSVSALWGRP